MKNVGQDEVIRVTQHHIIYIFGIIETIITNQGAMFIGDNVVNFIQKFVIKLIQYSPYYAQSNEQVETTNKIIIDLIKKNMEDK